MAEKLLRFGQQLGCHQRPDRSFFFRGHQFPVCARCTGVFIGQIIALILRFFIKPKLVICVDMSMILLIDWMIQYLKIKESTNFKRLITGILGGYGLFSIEIEIILRIVKVIM